MPFGYTPMNVGGPSFGGPSFGMPGPGGVGGIGPQNAVGGGGGIGEWLRQNGGWLGPLLIGGVQAYQGTQANAINKQQLAQSAAMSKEALAEQQRQFNIENAYRANPAYQGYLRELATRFGAPSWAASPAPGGAGAATIPPTLRAPDATTHAGGDGAGPRLTTTHWMPAMRALFQARAAQAGRG